MSSWCLHVQQTHDLVFSKYPKRHGHTSQQENGYDCGMYVFCLVDLMCSAFSKNDHGLHSPHDLADVVKKNITPSYVTQKRIELYQEAIRLRGIWQKQLQTSATKAKTITKK